MKVCKRGFTNVFDGLTGFELVVSDHARRDPPAVWIGLVWILGKKSKTLSGLFDWYS